MPKSARFAGSFLKVLSLSILLTLPVLAADLRPLKEPAKIAAVFPAAAKVRVLNVWATWCVPCVAEMPDLRAIDDAFGAEVAMAGVTLDDMLPDAKPAKTAEFLDRQKIAFPNVYYTGNADDLGERLRFSGEIPITIVFDRKGNELWRHEGRLDRDQTIAHLRETLRRMQ
jgi:thiol-disulfide isomerase/thioredoxin